MFASPSASLSSRAARPLGLMIAAVALSFALYAMPVHADEAAPATPPAYAAAAVPGLPSSAGLPLGAFYDPTRMSFHQSLEIGASTGGLYRGTAGLYTASFGYKLANPLLVHLDLGAAYSPSVNTASPFGTASYNPGFSGLFVKNFSLDWRPGANSLVRFSYQDMRSPLQWGPYGGYGYAPSPFGYSGFEQPSRN
jgi:hypothetical protein